MCMNGVIGVNGFFGVNGACGSKVSLEPVQ
jgi:hypothetical protein